MMRELTIPRLHYEQVTGLWQEIKTTDLPFIDNQYEDKNNDEEELQNKDETNDDEGLQNEDETKGDEEPQIPEEPISIQHTSKIDSEFFFELTLFLGNQQEGHLDYYWDPIEKYWEILTIQITNPELRRQYLGTLLLQEFVAEVGKNQAVHGVVRHQASADFLLRTYRNQVLLEAFAGKKYSVPLDELENLPIKNFLELGGVTVGLIAIGDEYFSVYGEKLLNPVAEVWGRTR